MKSPDCEVLVFSTLDVAGAPRYVLAAPWPGGRPKNARNKSGKIKEHPENVGDILRPHLRRPHLGCPKLRGTWLDLVIREFSDAPHKERSAEQGVLGPAPRRPRATSPPARVPWALALKALHFGRHQTSRY